MNLYTTNQLGIFPGPPIRGETCSSEVINIDVTKVLKPHWAAGTDHVNIHTSEWIHGIVVNEVLWACPPSAGIGIASEFKWRGGSGEAPH